MALLTALSWLDAVNLLQPYGLELSELEPLASGSVNSNFFLRTTDGRRWFARLYEEQSSLGAEFELRLNEALAEAGVCVARPKRTQAGELFRVFAAPDGRMMPFSMYERIDGDILCTQRVTSTHTRAVGEALGRVHLAALPGLTLSESRFGVDGLGKRLAAISSSGRPELVLAGRELESELNGCLVARDPTLPSGLIHGDLFRDNVLFRGDDLVALLDFESASLGCFAYDLAVTALAWCYGSDFKADCLKALFEGYHSVRPLGRAERLGVETEGRWACVRFSITRITDFSMRAFEGEVPKRDYRRFLSRRRAIVDGAFARALSF